MNDELLLRAKYSFYSTLVFLLVTNPMTVKLLQSFGLKDSSNYFFQVFLFFLIVLGLMMFPKDR